MNLEFWRRLSAILATTTLLAASSAELAAAESSKEADLIALLESNAPAAEKAIACKELAVYGSEQAVPALASLLANPELSSWARISLEAIPGPAANRALWEAQTRLQGRLLIGVINSIGVRRDPQAVDGLVTHLDSQDPGVVAAAAVALGRIGGEGAARSLLQSLGSAPAETRSSIAFGCILCAERYLDDGKNKEAAEIYDTVRLSEVAEQRLLEATRGAILARGDAGLPLLLDQLRSTDKSFFGIGLRTARELPGEAATRAIEAEVRRSEPERGALILMALADRDDAAVRPAVLRAAGEGPAEVRLVAVKSLERLGDASSANVLIAATGDEDQLLSQAASETLTRLADPGVDAILLERLPRSKGSQLAALIEVAALRQIHAALPTISRNATSKEPGVRQAALDAIGTLGGDAEVVFLVGLLSMTSNAEQRATLSDALVDLSASVGASCSEHLLPLLKHSDAECRVTGINAMAGVGGDHALAAVINALEDPDPTVQDEAVRALSTWPNNWPEDVAVAEPLLSLATSSSKASHAVLGMRGYLQYVQEAPDLSSSQRVELLEKALSWMKNADLKRRAISTLSTIPSGDSLDLLLQLAKDAVETETAYSAVVTLASKDVENLSGERRREVLGFVLANSKNDATKKRAQAVLRKLR